MNTATIAAGAAGGVLAVAAGLVTASALEIEPFSVTATTTVSVPAPQNLRPVEVGPNQIKVSYGPSVVGPLRITPAADGRSAKITWGGAKDDLYPLGITYSFSKNGITLWKDRQQTYANVGFTLTVRRFTTCVVPHSQNGFGPKRCVTWTAP
jgi:hypothetical protein